MLKPQPKTSDAMNKETSTYLDCARFLAALTVMLCHIDSYMVVGVLPWVDHLGLEAVGVFFVLSGFVIGMPRKPAKRICGPTPSIGRRGCIRW